MGMYTIILPNGVEIHSKDKQNLPIKTRVQVAVAKMCPGVDKVLQSVLRRCCVRSSDARGRRASRGDPSRVGIWEEGDEDGVDSSGLHVPDPGEAVAVSMACL